MYMVTAVVVIASILVAPNIVAFMKTTNQMVVNETNSGQEVTLHEGDQLLAVLESNPSTGYGWGLTSDTAPDVLKNTANNYAASAPAASPAVVGAGGKEVWIFKALSKGKSAIQLDYYRPGEKVAVAKTFKLSVVVE